MKQKIIDWWNRQVKSRFYHIRIVEEKDTEILDLRRKNYELGEVIEKRENEIFGLQKDILEAASKITEEREAHQANIEAYEVKVMLLERRLEK